MVSKTQIKYIQSLFHKKFRDEYGHYVVEGTKMVEEALTHRPDDIKHIYALDSWITESNQPHTRIEGVNDEEMKRISALSTPSTVLAILEKPVWVRPAAYQGITLLLDTIQDPGNLGTIIRTADWFGVKHIICSEGSVDCFNPKVIQSTMGSIFRMNIFYEDIMKFIDANGHVPLLAASLQGKPLANEERWNDLFLVIGNESGGIRKEIVDRATRKLLIPKLGEAESLNAAVATGILLYALTN